MNRDGMMGVFFVVFIYPSRKPIKISPDAFMAGVDGS